MQNINRYEHAIRHLRRAEEILDRKGFGSERFNNQTIREHINRNKKYIAKGTCLKNLLAGLSLN